MIGAPELDLPRNLESEAALLGAMMIDNRIVDEVADRLNAEDFAEDLHGRVYEAIGALIAKGTTATPVTLKPLFERDPAMLEMGGVGYLAGLTANSGALLAARDFADQIRELAQLRRLILGLHGALDKALHAAETDTSVADLAEAADAALSEALIGTRIAKPDIGLADLFDRSLHEIETEARGDVPAGVTTVSLPDWNDLTGGMRPGEVTVLAARPKMGKTATALSIALGCAANGHGTAYFSLEMKAVELGKRMIADLVFDHGNCPSFDAIKRGKFTEDDYRRIVNAQKRIANWPFRIIDQRGVKIGRIAMMIRRMQRQMHARGEKLELVVLDYLQLIKPDKERKSRYEDVGEISRTLKQIAGEMGLHILLLAQVNRECEKREDKRPQPFDLRDAGDIEQDADTIAFLYRDEVYLKAAEPDPEKSGYEAWSTKLEHAKDRIEIYTGARRNGETMKRTCWFFAANQAVRGSRYFEDGRG